MTESQKIAKLLEFPKRVSPKVTSALQGQVKDLGATPQSSAKGSKPFTALVECCCGPESLLSTEAGKQGLKILRITKSCHNLLKLAGLR